MSTLASVFGYGTVASRPAASVAGRFWYGTDTSLMYRDNGSTWDTLTLAGAGTGTVTTVKDEGSNLSTAVVSMDFVGAGVAATGTTAVTVTIPVSMALTEATLAGDVTMVTANTFYDGPTLTPAAGTYDVTGYVSLQNTSSNTEFWTARLATVTAGPTTTVVDERETDMPTLNTQIIVIDLAARVTLGGSDVIKIMATANARTNQKMMRDPLNNSSAIHRATLLRIQRVA